VLPPYSRENDSALPNHDSFFLFFFSLSFFPFFALFFPPVLLVQMLVYQLPIDVTDTLSFFLSSFLPSFLSSLALSSSFSCVDRTVSSGAVRKNIYFSLWNFWRERAEFGRLMEERLSYTHVSHLL